MFLLKIFKTDRLDVLQAGFKPSKKKLTLKKNIIYSLLIDFATKFFLFFVLYPSTPFSLPLSYSLSLSLSCALSLSFNFSFFLSLSLSNSTIFLALSLYSYLYIFFLFIPLVHIDINVIRRIIQTVTKNKNFISMTNAHKDTCPSLIQTARTWG